MREVKVPDFMQPFEVIVNGVKHVFPAGKTVTVEDYIADIIEQSVPPKAEAKVERVMWEDIGNRPFSEEKAFETIVWDSTMPNLGKFYLEPIGMNFIKAHEYFPIKTESDFESLSFGVVMGGETIEDTVSYIYIDEHGWTIGDSMVIASDGQYEIGGNLEGIIFPAGIWFMDASAMGAENAHFVINPAATVKRLDEKYMPVLTSPNGTKFKISVGDDGSLSAAEVVEA